MRPIHPGVHAAALHVVLLLSVAACQAPRPSLFVEIEDPEALAPTQVQVKVEASGLALEITRPEAAGVPLEGTQSIRLWLPDKLAGTTVQLQVSALRDGALVGAAAAAVQVRGDGETQARVQLRSEDPRCPGEACPCDASTCPTGCCLEGGCVESPTPAACGTAGNACSACPGELTDVCVEGACRCGSELPCGPGYRCQAGACIPDGLGSACSVTGCSSPPGQCHQELGTCESDGTCTYLPRSAGETCDDGNSCTVDDACNGGGSCLGTPMSCNTPPGQCHESAGTCVAGTCSYAAKPTGTSCDDGRACTVNDVCDATGSCDGTVDCDSPPNPCHQAVGICGVSGSCLYETKPSGTSCDDGNPCTLNDACSAAGTCTGLLRSCVQTANPCLQSVGTCMPDMGGVCSFSRVPDGRGCGDCMACLSGSCSAPYQCGTGQTCCFEPGGAQTCQSTGTGGPSQMLCLSP